MSDIAKLIAELRAGLEGLPSYLSGDYNLVINEDGRVVARIEYQSRPDDGGTDIEREDADRLSYRIAAHIARCSPDNISALLDAYEEMRKALEFYADPLKYEPVRSFGLKIGFVHGEIHDRDRGKVASFALSKVPHD